MRQWEGAFLEGYWSEENGNEGLFDEHGLITINGLRRNIDRGGKKTSSDQKYNYRRKCYPKIYIIHIFGLVMNNTYSEAFKVANNNLIANYIMIL